MKLVLVARKDGLKPVRDKTAQSLLLKSASQRVALEAYTLSCTQELS
jgi:hypothetical protein